MKSKRRNALRISVMLFTAALSISCATTHDRLLGTDSSQVQLRSIQTRVFDTTDKDKTLRSVISTLQDLGFIVDKAEYTLGIVSATKIDTGRYALQGYPLRLTVTVRPRGERQLLVRANAEYNLHPVTDPKPYQSFFAALSKSMFLEAQQQE